MAGICCPAAIAGAGVEVFVLSVRVEYLGCTFCNANVWSEETQDTVIVYNGLKLDIALPQESEFRYFYLVFLLALSDESLLLFYQC